MRKLLTILALLSAFTGPAMAQPVVLGSSVYLETVEREGGQQVRRIEAADSFGRGERVVAMTRWSTRENAPFWLESRVPHHLRFVEGNGSVEISTDNGRSWQRPGATAQRVTNLRWRIDSRTAARGSGMVSYSAVVR